MDDQLRLLEESQGMGGDRTISIARRTESPNIKYTRVKYPLSSHNKLV